MARETYRKVIVTPELISRINSKNIDLMKSFLKEKNTRSAETTIRGYESDLNIFFTWNFLHNENKFFIDIRKLEFANFFAYVTTELQWGSARFSRLKACLSSLSQFVERFYDDTYPTFRNVILKVIESMPKNAIREKTILTEEQVKGLLSYLKEKDLQQACWFALALSSGSRFSELLRFTTDIIDENNTAFNGIFIETLKTIKSKGRSKTGKMIKKYIIKDLFIPYYKEWLIERSKIMEKNNKSHNQIFIKNDGSPAASGTVRSWIYGMTKFLGVPMYPHACRHWTTTYLSSLGIPPQLIQEIMSWESVSMVQIYDDTTAKNKEWKELDNLRKDLDK
jgi:integrase